MRGYRRGWLLPAHAELHPARLGAEQLHCRRGGDEALDPVEQVLHPAVALGDDRHRDLGPLPLVLMGDLGDRDAEPVAQAVDDRADRRPLRLEGSALGDVEIEAHRRRVHGVIVALGRGGSRVEAQAASRMSTTNTRVSVPLMPARRWPAVP